MILNNMPGQKKVFQIMKNTLTGMPIMQLGTREVWNHLPGRFYIANLMSELIKIRITTQNCWGSAQSGPITTWSMWCHVTTSLLSVLPQIQPLTVGMVPVSPILLLIFRELNQLFSGTWWTVWLWVSVPECWSLRGKSTWKMSSTLKLGQ